VVDGTTGAGNGLCIPAGPLRAPLAAQWPHVHAVVIIGEGEAGAALAREAAERGKSVVTARLEPDPAAAARLRGRRVFAFAGIGRPEKFFATLRECGATLVHARSFPDHHPFSAGEIRSLLEEAQAEDLDVVTTEKDFVRLAALADAAPSLARITALPVRLVFDDEAAMPSMISRIREAARAAEQSQAREAPFMRGVTPRRFSTASGDA
jgi:tetraacyldisaccharide 4'-kinase